MCDIKIKQTRIFGQRTKKLHPNEKKELDKAIREIIADPSIGVMKVGDLSGTQVYKYKCNADEYLVAYEFIEDQLLLTLIGFGSHENFYRDLKKNK